MESVIMVFCMLIEMSPVLSQDRRSHEIFPDDYDKYQPPWKKDKPAHVYIHMTVMDVDKIDEGALEYSLQMYMAERWKDDRLNLSGFQSKFDKYFTFPAHLGEYMWIPDLVFDNTKNGIVFHLTQPNRVIRLLSDGSFRRTSRWIPTELPMLNTFVATLVVPFYMTPHHVVFGINNVEKRYNLIVGCQMNFRLYPIDTQKCFLKIASMANSDLKLSLHWAEEHPTAAEGKQSIILPDDIQPLKYILAKPKLYKHTEIWASGNYTYLYANFTFVRRITGSIFNMYVPSTLVIFLSWISFWIDIEAVPARVTLGVTSLLTLATQMVQAHSMLPPINYMTAMDIWLFFCLITVFSSLIEFAISYHFHVSNKQKSCINEQSRKIVSVIPKKKCRILRSRMQKMSISNTSYRESSEESMKISSFKNKQTSLDNISRKMFPTVFFIFAATYWTYYLHIKEQ